jgi:hypothetical protein
MIHHVSIPARDVGHVARVLCELTGWTARPFPGPYAEALVICSGDEHGTTIEIYPDGTELTPGEGDEQGTFEAGAAPHLFPFHVLLTADFDADQVLKVAEREGWRALRCWRGPPGRPLFELIEFWVENRLMLELATPAMAQDYIRTITAVALGALGRPEPQLSQS